MNPMLFTLLNPWAILVASIVAYLVGWAWYSPLLWQKPWMAARGDTGENWETEGKKEMPKIMLYGFLNVLAEVFAVAVFLTLSGASSLVQTLQIALLLCFGFVVTVKFNDLIYTATPPHWGRRAQIVFLVDVGYQIALFLIAGSILWYLS